MGAFKWRKPFIIQLCCLDFQVLGFFIFGVVGFASDEKGIPRWAAPILAFTATSFVISL